MSLFPTKITENQFAETARTNEEKEEVRWSLKQDRMQEAIGELEHGKSIHFVTAAYWSMYELLDYVVRKAGPADVDAFTWNLSMSAVRTIIKLREEGFIKHLRFLCNSVMQRFIAESISVLQNNCEKLVLYPNHAKGFLLSNENWKISCISSANFSTNPQIEGGVICTDPEVFSMHRKWLEPLYNDRQLLASNKIKPYKLQGNNTDEYGRYLYIIRGLPGSGKSTFAKSIADEVYENDDFFTSLSGEYTFEYSRVGQARAQCFNNVKNAMERGVKKIAVANTFSQEAEFSEYVELAQIYSYKSIFAVVENRHGGESVHALKHSDVEKMEKKFKIKLIP